MTASGSSESQHAAFLTRVRAAVAAGRAYRVQTRDDLPPDAGYIGGGDDLCQRLAQEIDAVGGRAHLVADLEAARFSLAKLLEQYQPTSAYCWQHPLLDRIGLAELLAERQIARVDHASLADLTPDEQLKIALAADIGITSATFAVAETGSLAMASGPGAERGASLLPPVHVAIVERSQIVPDLFDLFAHYGATGADTMPSNLVLITGPSKTGDIELQLTTGVHGPGEWHVIVVSE
jgi:L-lactate dehydrogenase complex protein LldG